MSKFKSKVEFNEWLADKMIDFAAKQDIFWYVLAGILLNLISAYSNLNNF